MQANQQPANEYSNPAAELATYCAIMTDHWLYRYEKNVAEGWTTKMSAADEAAMVAKVRALQAAANDPERTSEVAPLLSILNDSMGRSGSIAGMLSVQRPGWIKRLLALEPSVQDCLCLAARLGLLA